MMKRILTTLFTLVIFLSASAQSYDSTKMYKVADYGWQYKRIKIDSILQLPNGVIINRAYKFAAFDSTSMNARINAKLNIADTAYMLRNYLHQIPTLNNVLNAGQITGVVPVLRNGLSLGDEGVEVTITTPSLAIPINITTPSQSGVLALLSDTASLSGRINLSLKISDTAAMLLPYARAQRLIDSITNLKSSIALKLNISDSAAMLAPYTRLTTDALKLKISDTSSMLAAYTRLAANSLKLNISDTAAMMLAAPRVKRFLDSLTNIKTSIATKQNTITLTTTGTSGAATLTGATLNIPQYLGGSASQDLQQVTDVGNATNRSIEMNGGTLFMNGGNVKFDITTPRGVAWGDDVHTKLLLPPASLSSTTTNYLPDVDGILATSLNGIAADVSGEITIPTASTSENGLLSATDWNTFNEKLNAADTNYLSTSKLNKSDTASMMAAAPRVQRFLDSVTNLKTSITLKLNKSDTASMLSAYSRTSATALKLNILDTSAMLTPYLRKVDTTSKFITSVFRKVASDSVFFVKGGANTFAFKDSIGTGGGGGSTNIYNTDGSLTGARTLTLNSQPLYFAGTTTSTFFANGRVTIGGTGDAGYRLDVIAEDARFNGVRVGRGLAGIATNTGVGNGVLGAITTGAGNTTVGNSAGAVITTGTNNTILGYLAGTALVDGSENVLIGSGGKALTSGGNNVMIGYNAGLVNTTGTKNTYVGWTAGRSGSQNTAIGAQCLSSVTGTGNTALGQFSGLGNTSGAGNIYLGFNAGTYATTQSNQLFISSFDNSNYSGDQTKSIIYGQQNTTTASQILTVNGNLGINTIAPAYKLDVVGGDARINGVRIGVGPGSGGNNTVFGNNALGAATTQTLSVAIGQDAGKSLTIGTANTIVGYSAQSAATTLSSNTVVGYAAGLNGDAITAVGRQALRNVTGNNNTAMGAYAGYNVGAGTNNVHLGYSAGQYAVGKSNEIFICGMDNGSYANDQTRSAFYAQQNSTTSSQIVTLNGNVGINTISPAATAVFDITSTTKGFLPPRMTTIERTGIASPAEGLTVYDLTLHKLYVWDGTAWQAAF